MALRAVSIGNKLHPTLRGYFLYQQEHARHVSPDKVPKLVRFFSLVLLFLAFLDVFFFGFPRGRRPNPTRTLTLAPTLTEAKVKLRAELGVPARFGFPEHKMCGAPQKSKYFLFYFIWYVLFATNTVNSTWH